MIEYRIGNDLDLDQVIELYRASTLGERRPIDDRERFAGMVRNANLVITAWDGAVLVGISRSITDFHYFTYLADLAKARHRQRVDAVDSNPWRTENQSAAARRSGGGSLLSTRGIHARPASLAAEARRTYSLIARSAGGKLQAPVWLDVRVQRGRAQALLEFAAGQNANHGCVVGTKPGFRQPQDKTFPLARG
jgi:hypothetical protein